MNPRRIRHFIPVVMTMSILLNAMDAEHKDASSIIDQEHEPDITSLQLPPNAVKLKQISRFPIDEDLKKGNYLSQPEGMAMSHDGYFFISDTMNDEIYKYDRAGKWISTIGRTGQGPGDLLRPKNLAMINDNLIVREISNSRFQIFDSFGKYLSGFRLFRTYDSFIIVDDRIYIASLPLYDTYTQRQECLIDILDLKGHVVKSFGKPLEVNRYDFPMLNWTLISPGADDAIWVVFKCFPMVRKYALDGTLVAEYNFHNEIAEEKEAYNKRMNSIRTYMSPQYRTYYTSQAIYATRNGLYSIDSAAGKRFLISLMENDGQVSEYYWAPKSFGCSGLIVIEENAGKYFYILNTSEACVDVYYYSIKAK